MPRSRRPSRRPGARSAPRAASCGSATPTASCRWSRSGTRRARAPLGEDADRLAASNLAAREAAAPSPIGDLDEAPELAEPSLGGLDALRALGARAVVSTPIVVRGPVDRRAHARTATRARAWSRGDVLLHRGCRGGSGPDDPARAAARREPRAARPADGAPSRRAGAERRARGRARCSSGSSTRSRSCCRPTRPIATSTTASAACCAAPPCTASTSRSSASSSRLRAGSRGSRSARAGRSSQATTPSSPTRCRTRRTTGFTDAIVAPMRWSDDVQGVLGVGRRSGLAVHAARRRHARGVRGPRLARASQRGDVHAELAAGARPARLLPRRVRARAVAVARGDARGDRAGRGRGARRRVRRGADAERAEARARAARTSSPASSRPCCATGIESGDGPLVRAAAHGRVLAAPALDDDERLPDGVARGGGGRRLPRAARGARRGAAPRGRRPRGRASSPRSASSPTTTSSSRAISPTRRAARSSAASCSRRSEARARSRSS